MEQLLKLSPDDEPELFYKKLLNMPIERIKHDYKRFEEMANYKNVINCYLKLLKKPEYNIKLVYNENGWHLTCCDDSNPDFKILPGYSKNSCECTLFINNPDKLFSTMEREVFERCNLCKRWVAEWNMNNDDNNNNRETNEKELLLIEKKFLKKTGIDKNQIENNDEKEQEK